MGRDILCQCTDPTKTYKSKDRPRGETEVIHLWLISSKSLTYKIISYLTKKKMQMGREEGFNAID